MIKVVAENINIMSKYTGTAMREKDPETHSGMGREAYPKRGGCFWISTWDRLAKAALK